MPSGDDIQRSLTGVWRLMTGRQDGMRMLDVSIDGFWNSFFAIVVALPPLVASWVPMANEACGPDSTLGERLFYMLRLGSVDILTWVLPIALLAAVATLVGIRDRFVHYVVASNWGAALFCWIMLPTALLQLFAPSAEGLAATVALVLILTCLVLSWRLTNAVLAKGPVVASGVFAGMFVVSMLLMAALQGPFGLPPFYASPAVQ